MIYNNERKNKNTTVGTIPNLNIKIAERGNIDTPNTQIHEIPLSWHGTGTSIKCDEAKLVFWFKTSVLMQDDSHAIKHQWLKMDILTLIVINYVDVINRSLFTNILTILFLLSMNEVKLFQQRDRANIQTILYQSND